MRINSYTPLADEITTIPSLISPTESEVTAAYNKVELRWQAIAGASAYLVEVDRSSSFNIDELQFIATTNSILLEDILDADRNYRWRITPYNPSYTCATSSETGRFRTGISTNVTTISTVEDWSIQPNPVTQGNDLLIQVEAASTFEADLKVYNITGQLLENQVAINFERGNSIIQLNLNNLGQGVYFVTLENEQGVLNKKLIIQ